MKKIAYLCTMMLLSVNMMAQIDLDDGNWDLVFYDEFNSNNWDTWANWKISCPSPVYHYRSYYNDSEFGVTHGAWEHQVYQRENCQLNNGNLQFVSMYEGGNNQQPLSCGNYILPPNKICDTTHHTLFYTSGMIETTTSFLYGYFEICCSLPIHKGSFPAFWLYSSGTNYYNELDIFEYPNGSSFIQNEDKQYTCGLYCDNNHSAPNPLDLISYGKVYPVLPNPSSSLSQFHKFSCEWMPDHITWYCDGHVMNVFDDYEHIPHHPMKLIANYAINGHVLDGLDQPLWFDGDNMVIDYIKVYQLKTDCDSDVVISTLQDFVNYQPSVKKTIRIAPSTAFAAPSNANLNFRASESIIIGSGFTLPQGAQITLQTQICPE